jgi:glycine/D-amino acid oxidase-like deaminating enzyme
MKTDVAIIGGGITGCAAAYYLARRGVIATVFEQGEIGCQQSRRAWGFVRQQGRHPAELPLARESSLIWENLGRELEADVEFIRGGIVVPASNDSEVRLVEQGCRLGAEQGLGTRLLSPREIRSLIPEMKGNWLVASYTPNDGHAEPIKATLAFAAAAGRLGAAFRIGTPVEAIEVGSGKVVGVRVNGDAVETSAVLCAGGMGAAPLLEAVGVAIPIRLARSTVCEVGPIAHPFTRLAAWGPRVAFRPTGRGTFYLGNGYSVPGAVHDVTLASFRHLRHFLPSYLANWRRMKVAIGRPFFDDVLARVKGRRRGQRLAEPGVDERKVRFNQCAFGELFPHLGQLPLRRSWAGLMDLTPDMIPVIGTVPRLEGLHIAAGFSGHGFALAPIIGKLLAELIIDGKPSLDLAAFNPLRFEAGWTEPAREVL